MTTSKATPKVPRKPSAKPSAKPAPARPSPAARKGSSALPQLLSDAARCLQSLEFGSAIGLYRDALKLAPDNAGASMGLAIALNRVDRPGDALPLLQRLLKSTEKLKSAQAPTFKAAVLAQLGYAQQQLGQIKLAHEAYEAAHALQPSDELQARIRQLQPHVASQEPVRQLLLHARRLGLTGQLDKALKVYNAAMQLHSDNVDVLHGLALIHRQMQSYDVALQLLQKANILAPDRADIYNDMGILFQDRGDLSKAVSFHKRALKLRPDFASALLNLGVACKRQGKTHEAISAYQAALEVNENFAEAHNNLGNLLRLEGQLKEARHHLGRAIALKPDYADALANWAALTGTEVPPDPVARKRPGVARRG